MRVIDATIHGYLVGHIWMPDCECYKPLRYSIPDAESRWGEPGTLRDHLDRATMDGDFQSCQVADGVLEITIESQRNGLAYRRTRMFDLSLFPSIKDYVNLDWYGPDSGEE